jgi:hypothetical protein
LLHLFTHATIVPDTAQCAKKNPCRAWRRGRGRTSCDEQQILLGLGEEPRRDVTLRRGSGGAEAASNTPATRDFQMWSFRTTTLSRKNVDFPSLGSSI